MSVTISLHPGLQYLTNSKATVKVKGNTVGQCLDELVKNYPKMMPQLFDNKGRLRDYIDIYVNQESAYPEELAKAVKDGDELYITIIIAGG
jgi:molybdopterin synthase sulfur carrier subunit